MRVIALETSTGQASVAFVDGDNVAASRSFDATASLSRVLIPTLEEMARGAWPVRDADLIVVPRGPGSFTGLRVAMAAAKGLAIITDLPVVAISSLEALAFASGCRGRTVALLDARGGLFFYAVYDCSGAFPEEVTPPALGDGELLAGLTADAFVGPAEPPASRRGRTGPTGRRFCVQPDAAALAALGVRAYGTRGADDITTLRPTYIKRGQV
ncbi:MAG TPA: tRNA (adenosine(37)-N6)-threonylcarbamoyltransferase complex dimerization subunit type 1 TsaB [bacterium]|nr:tRNA (adenosine(37)-N6)-threonylcarbamoyltransferase complex dimerization subunit type 1 TsaB [bacterium]